MTEKELLRLEKLSETSGVSFKGLKNTVERLSKLTGATAEEVIESLEKSFQDED